MKRKTSATPTRIWSFGALPPTEGGERLLEQLFQAHRYYNTLIEIERRRREKFRAVRSECVPELAGLEAEWLKLDAAWKAGLEALPKPEGKKKRAPLTPELLAMQARRKELGINMKRLRAEFIASSAQERVGEVDQAANAEGKAAREATEAYWGSYLLIEKQIEQARKAPIDPGFKRFEGNGRIGVQLQGGLSVAELMSGEDTRLRLGARTSKPRVKKPKALHEVRIRIGSEGRAPIWATLPVVLHRELPADAKIQWAWIKVRNNAGRRRYFLQIAMESETFQDGAAAPSIHGSGTVAINIGWRAREDGSRRVAYAVDTAGNEQEFCIPAKVEAAFAYASTLRSARDLHFEEAKRALGAFLALKPKSIPEWLKEDSKYLWQWRSPSKLAKISGRLSKELEIDMSIIERWRTERLADKRDLLAPAAEVFGWIGKHDLGALASYLELWRAKNRHLWWWETDERDWAMARRNELFRVWSRQLANRYSEIRIEEFDLRKMAKVPEPDEESRPKGFRVTRAAAAPGEFRSRLVEATGRKIVKAPAHGNTVTCYECRHVNERSLVRMMICARCGKEFDQDANNCRNQLRERLSGAGQPGGARNSTKSGEKTEETGSAPGATDATVDVVAAE